MYLLYTTRQHFEREIAVWDKLRHEHILTFYGIVTDMGHIHMVSPWQEHGNVLKYVLLLSVCNILMAV